MIAMLASEPPLLVNEGAERIGVARLPHRNDVEQVREAAVTLLQHTQTFWCDFAQHAHRVVRGTASTPPPRFRVSIGS